MSLTLLQGPAGSGKTFHCLVRLRLSRSAGDWESTVLLAPAQNLYSLRAALPTSALPVLLGRPVLSLDAGDRMTSFGGWVLGEGVPEWDRRLETASQILLLRRVLREGPPSMLDTSARTLGFSLELARLIREWKEAMLEPADVQLAFPAPEGPSEWSRPADLARLFARYQEALAAESVLDTQDLERRVLRQLASSRERLGRTHFLVDGFSNFTRWQLEVLGELAAHAGSLVVTFLYEEGRDWVFRHLEGERQLLTSLGGRAAVIRTLDSQRRLGADSLRTLERGLFRGAPVTADPGEAVEWMEAPDPVAELEEIARRIRRMVRDDGYRFDEIAVLFRNLAPARRRVEEIFAAHGIPAFVDSAEEQLHTAPARAARQVLALHSGQSRADVALALFRSPLVPALREDADALELMAGRQGIRSASMLLEQAGASLGPDSPIARVSESLRARFANGAPRSAEDWVKTVRECLEALGAGEARRQSPELHRRHRAAWDKLDALLDVLASDPGKSLSRREFDDMLTEMLTAGATSDVPRSTGQVLVADIFRSRLPELRALFVPGLNEGVFPARPQENALFGDSDREELNLHSHSRLPLARTRADEEYYLFYVAVTRASERLVLSSARADLEGSEHRPSIFLAEVRRVLPGLEITPASGPDRGLRAPLDEGELDASVAAALWREPHDGPQAAALLHIHNARLESRGSSPWATTERLEQVEALRRDTLDSNASRLETFATCPFQHFARHELRLEEARELDFGALEDGTLLDSVSTSLLREVRDAGGLAASESADELKARLKTMLRSELESRYAAQMARPAWKARVPRLEAALGRFADVLWKEREEGRWEPRYFQLSFGSARPADDSASRKERWKFTTGKVELRLEGRLDRVDLGRDDPGSARVVDFKRSSASAPAHKLRDGRMLQTGLYSLALEELWGVRVLEAGNFAFRNSKFVDLRKALARELGGKDPAEPPDTAAHTRAQITRLAELIASGDSRVRPSPGACAHCDFGAVCRLDRWEKLLTAEAEREEDDDDDSA